MRHARVAGEEGVGAEHDRRVGGVGEHRHDAVVQRRGIHERLHAREQRQQHAAGHAEGVEHRQRVEHAVGRIEIDARKSFPVWGEKRPTSLPRWYSSYLRWPRSEEHTSELQSLMRTSYAVFCLKKKTK